MALYTDTMAAPDLHRLAESGRLWAWSVSALEDDGLRRAAVALQDGYAFNVNLALWSVWAARLGYVLRDEEVVEIVEGVQAMDRYVVRRLREVRRYLAAPKPGYPLSDLARLRTETYEAELAGERLVQLRLEAATLPFAIDETRSEEGGRHHARRLFTLCQRQLENPVVLADELGPEGPGALFATVLDLAPDPRGFAGAEGKRERDDA
nr:TIGR02444 family protein [Parvularcula dongshanensis]